jgi:predicted N-acyltransferase
MHVEELRDGHEWESFLQTSPEGTLFHSLKWRNVIERSSPNSPLYLTVKDENGTIVAICPGFVHDSTGVRVYDSIPFSDYGGPLVAAPCVQDVASSLLNFLQGSGTKNHIAYAKMLFSNLELARSFKSPLSTVNTGRGVIMIDLQATPADYIWNKLFSKYKRQNVRHIERDGYQVREAQNRSDLVDFYKLYYQNMKHIGASPHSFEFMQNVWSVLYPQNLRIWLVGKDAPIGGAAVLKDERGTYGSYLGLERGRVDNRYSFGPYLIWKEIQRAEEEGYKHFYMGGTPSDPHSYYHIQKAGFGGKFIQQETVYFPVSPIGSILLQTRAKAGLAWSRIWKYLPKRLRHLPASEAA